MSNWNQHRLCIGGLHGDLGEGVVAFKNFMHAYYVLFPFRIVWTIQNCNQNNPERCDA